MGVLLALIAAIVFGGSDFAAGLASRRLAAGPVAVFVQAVGVAAAGIAVLIVPGAGLTTPALAWGALSGVGTAVGTLGLYHGLSVARMSVVAPVSAVLTAVLPVGVGLLLGERLSAAASAGIVVAVIAIALVSRGQADPAPGDRDLGLRGNAGAGVALGWGSVAGAGFALLFVALDQAGTGSGAWPLLPGQLVSLLLVAPFGWRARPR
ncbi:MAG: EamA family transporter, partial [Microlunatus sp.]|nr:EamA family transporter [Microlunatus sp.]